MENSILMAEFWGLFMVLFSFIFLLSPGTLERLFEYIKDEKILFILGLFSFFMGLVSIVLHNKWDNGWHIYITIFGWLALIKGILRMVKTPLISRILLRFKIIGTRWLLLIVVLIGTSLLYYSYQSTT